MAVVVGVHPGGKSRFAVCGLFWAGRWPALHFTARLYSSVQEAINDIVGTFGEWGPIAGMAVDAPLTWSAAVAGTRRCDRRLRQLVPPWVPSTWLRAPNSLPGATTVQGPALVWSIAREAKQGVLTAPEFYETHARCSLARAAGDLQRAILGYRNAKLSKPTRQRHVATLVDRFVDAGLIKLEADRPTTADALDALAAALAALGHCHPESGLLVRELSGEEIRPVGRRTLLVLDALP